MLARANGDRLFALAHRILRDVDRAEDATQQTLVIAWRELPRLRDPDRFDGWLQRILVNCCYAEAGRVRRESGNVRKLVLEPAAGEVAVRAVPVSGAVGRAPGDDQDGANGAWHVAHR